MSSLVRRFVVVGAGAALLVGAAAGPLSAASSNKIYSASVNPSTLPYSGSGSAQSPFTVTFTNLTPSASINSVTVTAPSGYTINSQPAAISVTEDSGGSAGNYNVSLGGATITVTNLSPVGYLHTVSVTFTATATWTSLSCTNNSATWTTTAFTGSNLGGNQFTLSGSAPTTSIGTGLAVGAWTTVNGVKLTNVGSSCVVVTVTRNGNSVTVLKPTASGEAFTLDVLWDPEPAVLPLPVDQVTSTAGTSNPIQWCNGTTSNGSTSNLAVPASQVSCLVSETSQVYGPDANGKQQVQVHDLVYLLGDYSIVRG